LTNFLGKNFRVCWDSFRAGGRRETTNVSKEQEFLKSKKKKSWGVSISIGLWGALAANVYWWGGIKKIRENEKYKEGPPFFYWAVGRGFL